MDVKKKAGTAVTEAAAQAVLRRGAARELGPDEERVMRMRLGASLPRTEPLERVGQGLSDVEIELLAYEIEAWMRLGRRSGHRTPSLPPAPSRAKEKIVRALRKKG